MSGRLAAMPKSNESCSKEGLYQSACSCKRLLRIETGPFPVCPVHGEVDWNLIVPPPAREPERRE
jgi:hypothetical protein